MEVYQKESPLKKTFKNLIKYLILIILSIIILGPFVLGIWTSLLPTTAISKGALWDSHISIANYVAAIQQTPILRYLLNSFVISTVTMLSQMLLCSMSAYAFVFLRFKYRNAIFTAFLITMMLPYEAEVIPNVETIKFLGLFDHYAAMIVPFLTTAFGTFMLRQSFMQIPKELKEASEVEGLNHWQFYWKVVLPYSKVSLLTLGAYSFLTSWNEYLWPMLTTFSDNFRPVQDGLRQLQSQESSSNWGMILASTVIVVIPTLIVLFIGQHYFKSGLNEGSVK